MSPVIRWWFFPSIEALSSNLVAEFLRVVDVIHFLFNSAMEVQYAAVFGPKGKPSAYSALRVDGSLYTFSSARTVGLQDDIDVIGLSRVG